MRICILWGRARRTCASMPLLFPRECVLRLSECCPLRARRSHEADPALLRGIRICGSPTFLVRIVSICPLGHARLHRLCLVGAPSLQRHTAQQTVAGLESWRPSAGDMAPCRDRAGRDARRRPNQVKLRCEPEKDVRSSHWTTQQQDPRRRWNGFCGGGAVG